MSANRASSGVRNLRAMFENQNAASSPEPRGRSPAGSTTSNDTSRPTSKIRASFVSVEPSGFAARDLGTTKGTSNGENSAAANRRESFSISEDHGADVVNELKKTVSQEKEERKKSEAIIETIPEQAVEDRDSSRPPPPIREASGAMVNLGSIMKGSDFPEPQAAAEKEEAMVEEPAKPVAESPVAPKQTEEKPIAPSPKATPGDNPDKTVSAVQDEEAVMKPSDLKDEAAVSGGEALPPPTEVLPSANAENVPPQASEEKGKGKAPEPAASAPATQSKSKTNGTTTTSAAPAKVSTKTLGHKPPAISTTKEPTNKPLSSKSSTASKSPAVSKAPRTPTTPSTASPKASAAKSPAVQAKEQPKAPAPKASRTSLRSSTASAAPSAAAKPKAPVREAAKAPAKTAAPAPKEPPTQTSPFRKPKPRSPTRPVRLPSHLTAPTASSAAKHDDGAAAPKTLARKPSTVSRPPPKAAAPVRKQPSRASLPAQSAVKRPESRQSAKGPDESFLARMMRPTTSSASKTADKVSSPPRRGASVKAPARPKSGQESLAAKGKRKVEEGAAKAKEVVTTNGHGETNHHADEPGLAESANAETAEHPEKSTEATPETPPTEQAETSGTGDILQTPNFGEQTIR